ncbi:MAG TPA: NmrA/HSCARG family protein [Vicinamibacterales bacterium]|jgi:uncharacterized protein YbjT (DUF2867 family)
MADKKIIAVVGATGAQGNGLVRAILADRSGQFAVRAITRNPDSEKAKALAAAGAEVVAANVDDEASLSRAFAGAFGAFCVTFFWDHFSAEKEVEEAGNMARAAKTAGVKHVVWSTLDDTRRFMSLDDPRMPTLGGKYKVPHFDGKGEADQQFRDAGVPTTFLLTVFYWENFISFGAGPQPAGDGSYLLTMPMGKGKLPAIGVDDIGKCALGVFKRPDLIGRTIGIAGGAPTGEEMAAAMSKALGVPVKYNDVPPEVYRGFGFPGADDMGNMFQFKRDFNDVYVKSRSVELARELNPELQSFDQWLATHASAIPLK